MTTNKMDELMNVPVRFGLAQQGHITTIERMLAEGKTWEDIGREIGWCPKTAEDHYEWYLDYVRTHS